MIGLTGIQLPPRHGVAARLFALGIVTRADLMVTGGYGHSRLREFVLAGVTRDTLARADIPTLLSD
jgi:nucleotide-binding universal stress UspA family protein